MQSTASHCAGSKEMEATLWLVTSEGLGDRELSVSRNPSFQGHWKARRTVKLGRGNIPFELLH